MVNFDKCKQLVRDIEIVDLASIPHSDLWIRQYKIAIQLSSYNQQLSDRSRSEAKQIFEIIDKEMKMSNLIENSIYMHMWFQLLVENNSNLLAKMPQVQLFKYFTSLYWVNLSRFIDSLLYFANCDSRDIELVADLIELSLEKIMKLESEIKDILNVYQDDNSSEGNMSHEMKLKYDIFCSSISTICTIILNIDNFPLSIAHFCFKKFNALSVLVNLLERGNLFRQEIIPDNGSLSVVIYSEEGDLKLVGEEDKKTLTHLESKIWMSICSAFSSKAFIEQFQSCFDLEKQKLIERLLKFDSENLKLQITPVKNLMHQLNQISLLIPGKNKTSYNITGCSVKTHLLIEQETGVKERIMNEFRSNEGSIKNNLIEFFSSNDNIRDFAAKISEIFDDEDNENYFFNGNSQQNKPNNDTQSKSKTSTNSNGKCATCFSFTTKRCGRCKSVWYCNRDCQVKNWTQHKMQCKQEV